MARPVQRHVRLLLGLIALACMFNAFAESRAERAARRVTPDLQVALSEAGLPWGAPVFIRIFKQEHEVELWIDNGRRFELFRTYPICAYSGALGPKLRQGDRQSPEGFYRVHRGQMNPASQFHLSFNLGYPNAYDRAHARTGDFLMVHGNCVSIGCYAMGDDAIEEIYTVMSAAFDAGQSTVQVHAMPFRFDRSDVDVRISDRQWGDFWKQLQAGWEAFDATGIPPRIDVVDKTYRVSATRR